MDGRDPVHGVAVAGERDPQLLPHQDHVRVGYPVRRRDLLVGHEPLEDRLRDVIEAVPRLRHVERLAVRRARPVRARAGDGDADGGPRADDLVGGRGEGEAVRAEEEEEGTDAEAGLEGGEVGGIRGGVAYHGLTRGGRGGGAVELDGGGVG
ncbi:hypothetical protein QJS10_CPB11g02122 [Acorus calamus]|uniref:Uncharacterized protein n=1 Tax=Acorus calamus TaxID=4465 RepID=A0AAV9DV51_ACOCL|nr:hypothetical protein QJS10_CPB11g02122 [Acorus calamus]